MTGNRTGGLSIFHRLLINLLIMVICMSGILTTVFYVYIKGSFIKHTEEYISREFEMIANHFNEAFKDILERDLLILSANPIIGEFMMSSELEYEINARAMERLFLQSIQYTHSYQGISFVDYSGREKVRVGRTGRIREYRDLSGSRLFKKIEAGSAGNVNIDGPFLDKQGKASFSAGIHKTDEDIGEFGGAIIVESDLNNLYKDIDKIKIFGERPVWLFTPDGQTLKRPENRKAVFDPRPYISSVFQETPRILMFDKGVLAYQDLSIVPGNKFLRAAISIPSELMLEDINSALRYFFIVFLVSIILLSIIVYYLSRYLSRPIIELALAADRLAKGDLSAGVDVRSTGEVQMLVDSFNRMSKDLEKTTVSREYLDNVINSMPGIFYLFDKRAKFLRWNKNTEKVTGYSNEEIGEKGPLDFFDGEDRKIIAEKLQEAFVKGSAEAEAYLVSKSGQKTPYYFSAFRMGGAEEPYIIGTGIDITGRKRAEEEATQKKLELEDAYSELQATMAKLAGSNSDLQQFAYIASHDLQEPLRMVTSYLQLLERRYKGRLGADADEFIGFAVDGAIRLKSLILDMLTYSRVGTHGREFKPVNCEGIIKRVLASMQIAVEESGAVVTHEPLPTVTADETQLSQLFQNLIGNAIKFSNNGSPRVHISAEEKGNEWVFSVKDNGIGIAPEYVDRIFGVFQRLHKKEEYPGTGIGLAVCKKIVERHGGSITVKSAPGKGATFIISMPVKQII